MTTRTIASIAILAAMSGGISAAPASAKHGADDPAGHVRHGRDDATKLSRKHRQGGEARRARRGADDAPGHTRRGRGNDDGAGHR